MKRKLSYVNVISSKTGEMRVVPSDHVESIQKFIRRVSYARYKIVETVGGSTIYSLGYKTKRGTPAVEERFTEFPELVKKIQESSIWTE